MTSQKTAIAFRKYHRLLGFFLAGIMMIYAVSGVLLIFRETGFLKYEYQIEKHLPSNLSQNELREALGIKRFRVLEKTAEEVVFESGSYDKATGLAVYSVKQYPQPLQKMVSLHKATTNSPLYFLNIVFGVSLLFFAVSAFFMFLPKLPAYKTGLKVACFGAVFAVVLVFLA